MRKNILNPENVAKWLFTNIMFQTGTTIELMLERKGNDKMQHNSLSKLSNEWFDDNLLRITQGSLRKTKMNTASIF